MTQTETALGSPDIASVPQGEISQREYGETPKQSGDSHPPDSPSESDAENRDGLEESAASDGFTPRLFDQASTFSLPKRVAPDRDALPDPEGFTQALMNAHDILEQHGCLLTCGPVYAFELARLVVHELADERPVVCSIPWDRLQLLAHKANEILAALEACDPQTIVHIEMRLPNHSQFLAKLCADEALTKLVRNLRANDSVLVIAVEHARRAPEPAISALRGAGGVLHMPWLPILRVRWEKELDLPPGSPELDALWARINSHLSKDPASVRQVAERLTGLKFPLEDGKEGVAKLSRQVDESLFHGVAETQLTDLMEEGWQRNLRRTLLGLCATLSVAGKRLDYAAVRRLGERLLRNETLRVPVEQQQIVERKEQDAPFIARATSLFEEHNAGEEWLSRLDEMLRACGLAIDAAEGKEPVITCTMRYGWTIESLTNDIWTRYPGSVWRVVESVLRNELLYPETFTDELFANDAARVLVAASRCDAHAFPRAGMLNKVLSDAAAVATKRAAQHKHADLNVIALGVAHYLVLEFQTNDEQSDEKFANLLTEAVDAALSGRRLLETRLLVLTLGWLAHGTWLDAERLLLDILARTDVFGADHMSLRASIFYSLRRSMRMSFVSRMRILRNVAARDDKSPEAAFIRETLLAHLWHDALRQDVMHPLPALEECFASQLNDESENLDELIRLLWAHDHAFVMFPLGPRRDVTADLARLLLTHVNVGSHWGELSRTSLVQNLDAVIQADHEKRIEKGVAEAHQAFARNLEKKTSWHEIQRLHEQFYQTHANLSLARALRLPFEQYRCIAMTQWVQHAAATSHDDESALPLAADRLIGSLRRVLTAEQLRQAGSAWRDALAWLGELRRSVVPLPSVSYEARKEYEQVRDWLRQVQQSIRYLIDQLNGPAAVQPPAGSLQP